MPADLDDKQILVDCVDLSDMTVETPELTVARIRRAHPPRAAVYR